MGLFSFFRSKPAPSADSTSAPSSPVSIQFGLGLVQRVAQGTTSNVAVSPLGVLAALALALNGAGGTTRKELGQALFDSTEDMAAAEAAFGRWLRQLPQLDESADAGASLTIASSLWADRRFALAHTFAKQVRDLYDAEVDTLDFSYSNAASTINRWVQKQTKGRIPAIITPAVLSSAPPALLLLNAVHFRAKWASTFYRDGTRPGWFRLADGRQQEAQLMRQVSDDIGYLAGDGWQAISLPYAGFPTRFAMQVFLPNAPDGLPTFLKALNARSWKKWQASFSNPAELEVDLMLPRFRVEWSHDLVPMLQQLGLNTPFAPGADFSTMGFRTEDGGGFISAVLHKTFVEVDEEGTEAAAATAIMMVMAGPPPSVPKRRVTVKVDSPFFYAIVDQQDGSLIFAGTINELAQS